MQTIILRLLQSDMFGVYDSCYYKNAILSFLKPYHLFLFTVFILFSSFLLFFILYVGEQTQQHLSTTMYTFFLLLCTHDLGCLYCSSLFLLLAFYFVLELYMHTLCMDTPKQELIISIYTDNYLYTYFFDEIDKQTSYTRTIYVRNKRFF